MTVTRANIESILVQRCGLLMTFASMPITTAGSNQSLSDPIGYGLRYFDYSVTDITNVLDADLALLKDKDIDGVLDIAELRLLESIDTQISSLVDITNGPEKENFSQAAVNLEKRMARLQSKVDSVYGTGVVAHIGRIKHDYAEHNDTQIVTL